MNYQLNISISQAGLQQILSSGQSVVITNAATGPGGLPVAWVAFQPFQSNVVIWNPGEFSVYASTSPVQPGAQIMVITQQSARLGSTYTLDSRMMFSEGPGGPANLATILNSAGTQMTVGLQQSANVNGNQVSGPVSAVVLPQQSQNGFAPGNTPTIFVALARSGTVLSQIPGNALRVPLSNQRPTAEVVYNDSTGAFELRG
ncbi:MAG TPA: hypothetical protein VGQ36_03200 [Thermoanaerobaculia bacterium]|jgi:hypothetical protein|nr:hypothetical protein [Thermoanaerobaculia bacterium]